jgi:hypothetical protein
VDNHQKKAFRKLKEALDECEKAGLGVIGCDNDLYVVSKRQFFEARDQLEKVKSAPTYPKIVREIDTEDWIPYHDAYLGSGGV